VQEKNRGGRQKGGGTWLGVRRGVEREKKKIEPVRSTSPERKQKEGRPKRGPGGRIIYGINEY